MSHILVIGASSGIGRAVVDAALAKGHNVRAFSRHAESMDINHAKLSKLNGDALNQADVDAALADVDVVVQSLGVPLNLQLLTGPITLFSAATRVLIRAMQAHNVKRLIAVTGFGAGECKQAIHPLQRLGFNLVFGRAYGDKGEQERMICSSELDWTIARPGVLTNGAVATGYQVLVEPSSWKNGIISRASVADFIVRAVENDDYIGTAPVLVN